MAGTSYLPLIVEVAFGEQPLDTGTLTWTDISAYVRRNGVDFSRGWDTEAREPQAGRLTFTLNNESGDFTPGATGAFGEIRNRLPVRVSATVATATGNALTYDEAVGWYDMAGATYNDSEIGTVVLWTGLVESWRIFWENGVRSQVAVTCVDRWAAIRRTKFDGKDSEVVTLAQSPDYFWPCTDPAGSSRMTESVAGVDFLPTIYQDNMAPGGGANPQPWLGSSLPVFTTTAGLGESVAPEMVHSASFLPSGATSVAFTVSAWLSTGGTYGSSIWVRAADGLMPYVRMLISVGSGAQWDVFEGGTDMSLYNISAGSVTPGWHHMAVTVSISGGGAGTVKFYFDGTLRSTDTTGIPSGGWVGSSPRLKLYGGGVAYVGIWDSALSDAQILTQYQAGSTQGVAGETAAVRAARLLTYIDTPPTVTTTGTFTATMSTQDLADKSLGDALQECATAERGTIYMSTAGWPVLTSRSWRTAASVAFTIPATALGREVSWTLDDQQLANSATVERMVGDQTAGTVKARNDTSVTTYGEQNRSVQIWVDTDAQLLERANAEANIDAYPLPRSSDLTVDLLTKSATIPAATLLAADIGQRIAVSGLPAEAPGETEFYIENIADKITTGGWERTFTVSPRADYFTVEDATYGALDSTFVLAF